MSIFLKKKLAQRANLSSDDCRILDLWDERRDGLGGKGNPN